MPGSPGERMWCCGRRRKIVSPLHPQTIACTGRFFVSSVASEENSVREIMEEELRGNSWQNIKNTEETRDNEINYVFANAVLKCF